MARTPGLKKVWDRGWRARRGLPHARALPLFDRCRSSVNRSVVSGNGPALSLLSSIAVPAPTSTTLQDTSQKKELTSMRRHRRRMQPHNRHTQPPTRRQRLTPPIRRPSRASSSRHEPRLALPTPTQKIHRTTRPRQQITRAPTRRQSHTEMQQVPRAPRKDLATRSVDASASVRTGLVTHAPAHRVSERPAGSVARCGAFLDV